MLSVIGLSIIVIAWFAQLLSMKNRKISKWFVLLYIAGVCVLVYDGYSSGMFELAAANAVSMAVAFLVLFRLLRK